MRLRQAVVFWSLVLGLATIFVVLLAWEPLRGDSWRHALRAGPRSWDDFVTLAEASYRHGNPRWGQLVLALTFVHPLIGIALSCVAIAAVALATMTLIRLRAPDPRRPEDAWLLVQVIAIALVTMPQFAAVWFYRPVCTNYVFPLAVQLGWAIPYRFIADRPYPGGATFALAMLAIGFVAGAGNEHTGVGLVAGAAICLGLAWRRDRTLPVWGIAGVVGVIAGNVVLLTAPGQRVRYGGIANDLVGRIAERGIDNLALPGLWLLWLAPGVLLVTTLAGRALARVARRREIAIYVALAGLVIATALASPRQVARLVLAPQALTAIGIGVILVELEQLARVSRRLRVACAAVVVAIFAVTLYIHAVTWREARARVAAVLAARPGSTLTVPAYTFSAPTPFTAGDDLRSAPLRARLAHLRGLVEVRRAP